MSEKRYSLLEVTEILQISTDTLYSWEDQLPELKPYQQGQRGDRSYTQWEVRLLQQARQLSQYYNQDLTGARRSLESWISKNPRPLPQAAYAGRSVDDVAETSEEPVISPVFV
jgi:DNA-binding transcriptional MerR regulator